MSNTKAPDVSPEPALTTEAPLPVVARPSSEKGSESGSIDVAALSQQITERVQESLKRDIRAAQSDRDKRLNDYDTTKGMLNEIYGYIKKYPDNPDAAFREFRVDQMLKGQLEPDSSSALPGKVAPKKDLEQKALGVLEKSGIVDPTEQLEVRQEWAKKAPLRGFDSEEDALAGLTVHMTEFLVARAKRQAPASAAAAIAPRGDAQTPEDVATLSAQMLELQRGNLNDPANQAARTALREKLQRARAGG